MLGSKFGFKLVKQIAVASLSLALVGAGGLAWAGGDSGTGAGDAIAQASSVGAEAPEERLFTLSEVSSVLEALTVTDFELEGLAGLQQLNDTTQNALGGN